VTKVKKLLFCVLAGFSVLMLSSCTRPPSESESETGVRPNLPAPQFKLPDLGGQLVSLDQFKGKIVMLDFWATWCGPCRMTMPLLESLEREFPNDMTLLAINLEDTRDVVRDYVRTQSVRSRVLLDEEGTVGIKYGAAEIPMQVLIDRHGVVRLIQRGFGVNTISQLREQIKKLR